MTEMLFFKGIVVGFLMAAPVGPVGVVCIKRTLHRGRIYGLISGMGAATADALYGCIAAFGLAVISDFLVAQQFWFRLIGGGFVCFLGLKAWLAKPTETEKVVSENAFSYFGAYSSTFFLTLMSPMTVLGCIALFVGLGLVSSTVRYVPASIVVAGVFTGSGTWWWILSYLTNLFREKMSPRKMNIVNKVSGAAIFVLGIVVVLSTVFYTRY
jgi:threonine/homoserine/homoserine lactone efflux protein